ncbi:MAG TPA: hypothetical protein VH853_02465 [Polyangia bacterium]|jgi:fatty acid desaturase|nr:hypothetical protein [Polyangia bacterium]
MCALPIWPVLATLLAQMPAVAGVDSSVAAAQPVSPSATEGEPDSRPPTRWYGAPIVAADVATVGLLYATSAYSDSYERTHSSGWSGTGVAYGLLGAAYVFNGAMVHALNHQPRHAGQSALLRLGGG